jgi:hypothetical protein
LGVGEIRVHSRNSCLPLPAAKLTPVQSKSRPMQTKKLYRLQNVAITKKLANRLKWNKMEESSKLVMAGAQTRNHG